MIPGRNEISELTHEVSIYVEVNAKINYSELPEEVLEGRAGNDLIRGLLFTCF